MTLKKEFLTLSVAAFFLSLPSTSVLLGKELETKKWIEVSTDDIRVRSTLSERKTVKLLRELDLLRAAVPLFTNIEHVDSNVPTNILAVKRIADFELFGVDRNSVGWFRPRLRDNTILIRDTPKMDEAAIIIHEYVHFLMRNQSGLAYPRWYSEGYAEYLSGLKFSRRSMEIGHAPEHRVHGILDQKWLTPSQLLVPHEYDHLDSVGRHMFYAQAWALVHFLINRSDRETAYDDDMRGYLELTSSGVGEVTAFERAFGIDGGDLNAKLRSYVRSQCCDVTRYKIEQIGNTVEPEVRNPSEAEMSLTLGQTAQVNGKFAAAKRWYEIAVEDPTTRPRAETGLGDLLLFDGDYDAAESHYEIALELAPDDVYVQLDAGKFWLGRVGKTESSLEAEQFLERAKRCFELARNLDPTEPEAYVLTGRTYLIEGGKISEAIKMYEQAERLHPSNMHIRMQLAEAYAMDGRFDDAVRMARLIISWDHGNNNPAKFARELINQLIGVSSDADALPQ